MEQPRGGSHRARAPRQSSNRGPAVVVAAARWVCAPAPRQFSSRGPVGVVLCEHTPATNRGSSHSHVSEARWWNSPVGVLIARARHASPVTVGLLSWW